MSEPLLNVLKFCLLALLYLFFFRVLRATWAEVGLGRNSRQAAPASAAPGATKTRKTRSRVRKPPQLTVVEPAEIAGRTFPLGDELTIGRAAGCQITLDDTYVSQLHARLFTRDGQLFVEDLGSTNGTYLNKRKVSAPMVVQRGDTVQVGSVVMELT